MVKSRMLNTTTNYYNILFNQLADPRTNNWFLISSPLLFLIVILSYLYFVLVLGPKLMKNRPPFQLKTTLIFYNFLQVLISFWLFWESLDCAWWNTYNWRCEPVDFSWSPIALRVARGTYFYFLAKISELLDTFFFVLRKKPEQITFLHIYHHTSMPVLSWCVVKYYPGGHGIFFGLINSFVHIIMYAYYGLAVTGPTLRRYLWWKKYITTLQMTQFCIVFLHSIQLLFYDCGYPKWSILLTLPNSVFFYVLFLNFYNKSYNNNKLEKPTKTNKKYY